MKPTLYVALLVASLGCAAAVQLTGCGHREPADNEDREGSREEEPSGEDAPHALPLGHPVAMPRDQSHGGGGAGSPTESSLQWTAPDEWRSVTPSSSLRRAEWALPHQGSDTEDASLVVFYFGGGQGGSVRDNLDRWYGQFSQTDGRATRDVAHTETRTVSGMSVTIADVSGTFASSPMPGMPSSGPKAGFRMLAAIVETDAGPWFFKLIGPGATVEHWKASFDAFVGTLRRAS